MDISELVRVAEVIAKNRPYSSSGVRLRNPEERECKNCRNMKPIYDYYERNDHGGGYMRVCKRCHNIQNRKAKEASRVRALSTLTP